MLVEGMRLVFCGPAGNFSWYLLLKTIRECIAAVRSKILHQNSLIKKIFLDNTLNNVVFTVG